MIPITRRLNLALPPRDVFWLLVELEVHPKKIHFESILAGPSLAGRTLYVPTVSGFAWKTPCRRHEYYTYTTLLLHRRRIRFVVSSDVPLNPACGRSTIGAERPILIPSYLLPINTDFPVRGDRYFIDGQIYPV